MIKELSITNFKCFREKTIIPLNDLTVLAGINSVGKSTLIQALLLLRQSYDEARKRNFAEVKSLKIMLNGIYHLQLGNSAEVLNSSAGDEDNIIFDVTLHDGSTRCFKYSTSRESVETFVNLIYDGQFPESPNNISIFADQFQYLHTERIGPRITQKISPLEFPSTGCQGEYTADAIAINPDDKIEDSKKFPFNPELTAPTKIKQVEYWLNFLFPGIEIYVERNVKRKYVSLGLRRRGADTDYLDPSNLGYGISYVLPIIVGGLLAEKGTMLIVENPEVHLHPSAQSKIGIFLAVVASSGVQVILETHSEHIINGIRIASLQKRIDTRKLSINYFNLDDDLKTTRIEHIQITAKADLSKWPKGFLDQEQNDLRELITLRREM